MRTGTVRIATADEKVRALASKNVMEDLGMRKKETEEVRSKRSERDELGMWYLWS